MMKHDCSIWSIPYTRFTVSEKVGKKKVVFIDKPLPCKSLRTRYQNHKFHKYSLLGHMQQPRHCGSVELANQSLTGLSIFKCITLLIVCSNLLLLMG